MTYVLQHNTPARHALVPGASTLARVAVRTLVTLQHGAVALLRNFARIPSSFVAALSMVYLDPYQSSHRTDDPSDPQNF